MTHFAKMEVGEAQSFKWWLETSRLWIIKVYGYVDENFETDNFGALLSHNIWVREMSFLEIAEEWTVSPQALAELVADHIRRLE